MTCKHLFKAVALALSLAVGAAPALAKNFTELKAAASPAGGAWYVGMGAMGKAISTMYPELDVSLFPGGGLANVMHVEKGASDFGIAAHSVIFAAAKGIDPYKKPTENVMGLLNLHDSTRMHFIVNKASGITSLAQIKEKKMPTASPCPTPPETPICSASGSLRNTASASRTSPRGAARSTRLPPTTPPA